MSILTKRPGRKWLVRLASILLLLNLSAQAQTTTPNVTVEILGTGAESLIGGDLTDPENDGEDALGSATSPTWNWVEITASHEPDFEGGENSFNIFDNKVGGGNDKWCCDDPTVDTPVWVAVQFAQPITLTHFTVTSGNDTPDRDPTNWAIQGSNDGSSYTDIYRFVDTTVPWNERNQVVKFTLPASSQTYRYFRYIAFETPGSLHQINEIEYFGIVGGTTVLDTDKDGMPDWYEIEKGFNPNDASDAAKDFDGDGVSNLNEYKAGTDPIDTTKPTIVSAATAATFDTVKITFSEELDPATATIVANYTISPSLAVTAAAYKSKVVTLTTAAQTPGATAYTVTVTGVTDTSKNAVAAGTKVIVYSYMLTKTGALKISAWQNITGTAVQGLYDDPRYPATPDQTGAVFSFNSRDFYPTDGLENYGAVMEGYLTPTESGDYRFFIYSDDASQLFLGADDKPIDPLTTQWIAEEPGCCNNFSEPGDHTRTSEPISLVANKKYSIKLVYKEGGGGDYGQVAWRKEGNNTPAGSLTPIPGKYLSSAVDVPAPAEGAFLTQAPAANAKAVSPAAVITIAHRDGKTEWTSANTSLKINGAAVTPTFVKDGNVATITYIPSGLFPSQSTQSVSFGYLDAGGQPATLDWTFEVTEYKGPLKDSVAQINAIMLGVAKQTEDKGGFTGNVGDRAMDFGTAGNGQSVLIPDASFLNAAAAGDKVTFVLWAKKNDIAANSGFWADSPSSSGTQRGFQAHIPWSDGTIYFDTAGCCDTTTQRISENISVFPDYSGDPTWWNTWRHYAFVKNGSIKQIYIDGKLLLEGESTSPLPTDFARIWLGAEGGGPNAGKANSFHGLEDDFAIFGSALSEADIVKLAGKASPASLGAATKLVAYWDFNSTPITITDGLKAYWTFDGHLMDSIKDFDGTARGATPLAYVDGKAGFGKAIKLNGNDQFVEITGGNENELEFPGGSMSIAGWFKVDAFDTEWQCLISKGEGENYRVARRAATGTIAYAGGVAEGADDVPAVNDGQWHHFVAVTDANTNAFGTALYVDGVLKAINPAKPVLASSDFNLMIGENPGARSREWEGEIDDIAIWNRVLTASEVAALYSGGTGTPLGTLGNIAPPAMPPALTVSKSGANITIGWSPTGGTLESCTALGPNATWTSVGTANPATVPVGTGNVYYRVKN